MHGEKLECLEYDNKYDEPAKQRKVLKRSDKMFKTGRVNCQFCLKSLSVRSIDNHIQRCHPGSDKNRIKCDLCVSHITQQKMNRHLKLMHGVNRLRCRYCKKTFEDQKVLGEHAKICNFRQKRKPNKRARELAQCDVCHKTMQRGSLHQHELVAHRGVRPVCEHCGKKFGNAVRLAEHYRARHGYEKFKCERCDYQTASAAALANHERRHRGEKPFVCEVCGARFHASSLLVQHRHSHRTERSFKCDQCPSSFKSNNSLLIHRQARHGTRTYTCLICSRSYGWRHYAVRHLRKVHHYKGKSPPLLVNGPEKTFPETITLPESTTLTVLTTLSEETKENLSQVNEDLLPKTILDKTGELVKVTNISNDDSVTR